MPTRYTFSVWYCTSEAADATNSTRNDSEAGNNNQFLCLQKSLYRDTPVLQVRPDEAAIYSFRKIVAARRPMVRASAGSGIGRGANAWNLGICVRDNASAITLEAHGICLITAI